MKKNILLILTLVLGGLLWLFFSRRSVNPVTDARPPSIADATQKSPDRIPGPKEPSQISRASQLLAEKYPRWEGGRSTDLNDPRWKVLNQRDRTDRGWRGKVEIEFYGKVVDEKNEPVEGATVKFSKSDLSSEGTTQLKTQSDAKGVFSLTGVIGRGLGITVEKAGYYTSKQNRYGFEYAAFSDNDFYQPDSDNPVIFRLRKKQAADLLIYHEQELKIGIGATSELTLDTGAKLQIDLITNPRPKQGPWVMRVIALDGGLQPTVDEFPYSAPTDGYQPSLILDDNTPKPPTWENLYLGGSLYFKAGSVYGRIEMQMISGKDWMRIKSWTNPSGSRNLEFDHTKQITIKR